MNVLNTDGTEPVPPSRQQPAALLVASCRTLRRGWRCALPSAERFGPGRAGCHPGLLWRGLAVVGGVLLAAGVGATAYAAPAPSEPRVVHGVAFAPQVEEGALALRGAGLLRYLGMVPVYAAALYVDAAAPGADPLGEVAKRIEVEYLVSAEARRFNAAGDRHLRATLAPADYAAIEERLRRMDAWYPDPREGDRCAITYRPGRGTELVYNGKSLGVVEGADFARAYFSIWLGEPAASESLRRALCSAKE